MKFTEGPRGQEYTLEQKKRIKHLLEIADKNLSSPSLIGYHGSGLTSLKLLIETGKLFGRPNTDPYLGLRGIANKGDIHFYPRTAGFPPNFNQAILQNLVDIDLEDMNEEYGTKNSAVYAEMLSERDIFMEILGLSPANLESNILHNELSPSGNRTMVEQTDFVFDHPEIYREVLETAKKLGLDRNTLKAVAVGVQSELLSRQGLIFGLDKKLLDTWKLQKGDEGNDLFINCPDGLDYKLLCGLRPLGKKEKEFLESSKSKI